MVVASSPAPSAAAPGAAWMLKCVTTVMYWRLGYADWGAPIDEFVHSELRAGKLRSQGTLTQVTAMRAYPGRGFVQVDYRADSDLMGERFLFHGSKIHDFVEVHMPAGGGDMPPAPMDKDEAKVSVHLAFKTVDWLYADVYGDWDVHTKYLDKASTMFGAKGAGKVLAFKKAFLTSFPAYELDGPLYIDADHRAVTAPFECLIPGKLGKGVEVLQWNKNVSKLEKVEALRYG